MATPAEIKRIEQARTRLERVSKDWSIAVDGENMTLFAASVDDGLVEPIATFPSKTAFAYQDFLSHAATDLALMFERYDRAVAYYAAQKERSPKPRRPPNFASECAIKCQKDQAFRKFLIECHDLVDASDAERIKTKVRFVLNVTSLAELNSDPNAAARWEKLRGDFKRWMKNP